MGIIVPRPAMRAREERNLRATLLKHSELRREMREAGLADEEASFIAFNIVTTHAQRGKIWKVRKP